MVNSWATFISTIHRWERDVVVAIVVVAVVCAPFSFGENDNESMIEMGTHDDEVFVQKNSLQNNTKKSMYA